MASSAVEATVESCAAEASALGFTCTWHDRATGAPATGPRASLTLHLTHESADAVNVDFLPVLDRVQIFANVARESALHVAAVRAGRRRRARPAAARHGRRRRRNLARPAGVGAARDLRALPAPGVGLVAETTKALRTEASGDATWMRLLHRDAEELLVDPRDLPTADRMRRARDMYAAFVQFRARRRRLIQVKPWIGRHINRRPRLAAPRLGVHDEDPSRWGILSAIPVEQDYWDRFNDGQGLDWALRGEPYYRAVARMGGPRGPTW